MLLLSYATVSFTLYHYNQIVLYYSLLLVNLSAFEKLNICLEIDRLIGERVVNVPLALFE